eukprot:3335285-Rhodomonas_salina.1
MSGPKRVSWNAPSATGSTILSVSTKQGKRVLAWVQNSRNLSDIARPISALGHRLAAPAPAPPPSEFLIDRTQPYLRSDNLRKSNTVFHMKQLPRPHPRVLFNRCHRKEQGKGCEKWSKVDDISMRRSELGEITFKGIRDSHSSRVRKRKCNSRGADRLPSPTSSSASSARDPVGVTTPSRALMLDKL